MQMENGATCNVLPPVRLPVRQERFINKQRLILPDNKPAREQKTVFVIIYYQKTEYLGALFPTLRLISSEVKLETGECQRVPPGLSTSSKNLTKSRITRSHATTPSDAGNLATSAALRAVSKVAMHRSTKLCTAKKNFT